MRDPPLACLADFARYTLDEWQDLHEAMDEEDEYRRRQHDIDERRRKAAEKKK